MKIKKLLTWKGVANFAILGTAKWLSPKSHKALLDMTADKSWHYNNSRRHCWMKKLNSLNQSGMYEQGCWSTAQVTPGICHLQFFYIHFSNLWKLRWMCFLCERRSVWKWSTTGIPQWQRSSLQSSLFSSFATHLRPSSTYMRLF